MKLSNLYQSLKSRLSEHEARWILERRAGKRWADILTQGEDIIAQDVFVLIEEDVRQRLEGKPLSRIYGAREFWGMDFGLSPATLDPRPDTETLIEAALGSCAQTHPLTILDLGTGTGCILLALLKEFPEATGIGVDISDEAIEMAQNNAQRLDLAHRAVFKTGNWAQEIDESFDLLVSNPPYIRSDVIPTLSKEVQNHDPILALDGGKDGLDAYKNIFSTLPHLLNPCGKAFVEIGYDQQEDIKRLSKEYRIRIEHIYPDLSGNPRVVEISKKNLSGDK